MFQQSTNSFSCPPKIRGLTEDQGGSRNSSATKVSDLLGFERSRFI